MEPTSSREASSLTERLDQLRQNYLRELPAKLTALTLAWEQAQAGDGAALETLRLLVHKLAGSGTMFRCPAISAVAHTLEEELDQLLEHPLDPVRLGALRPELDRLASAVAAYLEPST
ncbi:MAG: Hpt domain-containing protein [Chloroflexi bacterium]|nr:Hpt domain-containing protein [Chloroflexota bacterium]